MLAEIWQKINEYDRIIIHRHINPDPDAYGSQGALADMITQSFPNKEVYCVGTRDPRMDYLFLPDIIDDALYQDALVIVCDTANTDRIDGQQYNTGDFLIKIDHHPNRDPYGNIQLVIEEAPATCALLLRLYIEYKDKLDIGLSDNGARLLYAGIIGDTGRFSYSLSKQLFADVATIIERVDYIDLYKDFSMKTTGQLHLIGYIYQNFIMTESKFVYCKISTTTLHELGVSNSEASMLIYVLSEVKDARSWALFIEDTEQGLIRCNLRAGDIAVNDIAERFGGGGHRKAAGVRVRSWTQVDEMITLLDERCAEVIS